MLVCRSSGGQAPVPTLSIIPARNEVFINVFDGARTMDAVDLRWVCSEVSE